MELNHTIELWQTFFLHPQIMFTFFHLQETKKSFLYEMYNVKFDS